MKDKANLLKKMVGKFVEVNGSFLWKGKIIKVVDEENFLIEEVGSSRKEKVSIFDIRSL